MTIFDFLIIAGMDKDDAGVIREALRGGALNDDAIDTIQMARRLWIDERDSIEAQFDRLLQKPVANVKAGAIATLSRGLPTVAPTIKRQHQIKAPGRKLGNRQ